MLSEAESHLRESIHGLQSAGRFSTALEYTYYWQSRLNLDAKLQGTSINVPMCNWPQEKIAAPIRDIKGEGQQGVMVYHPGIRKLLTIYPELEQYYSEFGSVVSDLSDYIGWLKVEGVIFSPNRSTTRVELEEYFKRYNLRGQRFSTYTLLGKMIEDVSRDPDFRSIDINVFMTRLLGSTDGGHEVIAPYDVGNTHWMPEFWWMSSNFYQPWLGGRSEQFLDEPSHPTASSEEVTSSRLA